MKILLINIDSKIPNIALKKIEKYYLDRDNEIIWDYEMAKYYADRIYVSCIFDWNKNKCNEWEGIAEIGGSGYDLKKKLLSEFDNQEPKINIGFTTRGCIKKCKFCIVPKKEGKIRVVGDIYKFWDGKSKNITLLDNNILAMPKHFELICSQLKHCKLKVDFNQGLDIRLLNDKNTYMLSKISHKEYYFAFDNLQDEKWVIQGMRLLKKHGINRAGFYILTGYNTTYKEDLYRANLLRELKQRVFIQRYNYTQDKILSIIARWGNQHNMFEKKTFKEFVLLPKHKSYINICREVGLL